MLKTKEKISYKELSENLDQFIGSMEFFAVPYSGLVFTEGVKYFAETCECFWLIDHLAYNLRRLHKELGSLFIDIEVNKRHTVHITVREDKDMPIVYNRKIHDVCEIIPIGSYRIWLLDNTLLLPSEY